MFWKRLLGCKWGVGSPKAQREEMSPGMVRGGKGSWPPLQQLQMPTCEGGTECARCLSPCHVDKPHHVASQSSSSRIWVCGLASHFPSVAHIRPLSEPPACPLKWGHQLLP